MHEVHVSAPPASFHLFDRRSGRRLTWLPAEADPGLHRPSARALAGAARTA